MIDAAVVALKQILVIVWILCSFSKEPFGSSDQGQLFFLGICNKGITRKEDLKSQATQ